MPPATSVRSVHLDSGGAGYDQSLLATTQEVSRAAKQESYNVDLLDDPQIPTTHVLESTSGPGGTMMGLSGELNKEANYNSLPTRGGRGAVEEGYRLPNDPRRIRPWYRRPAGIITIAIVLIVIVGAVVGGAVGGTVGHHKNGNAAEQQTVGPSSQNGQGGNSGQQGVGTAGGGSTPIAPIGNGTTPGSQSKAPQ